jgi:hypothetical protein
MEEAVWLVPAGRGAGLKEFEHENARLKKLVAERDLEIEVMKEIAAKMVGVPARREQGAYAMRRGLSQRRLCTLLDVSRAALDYRSVKAAKDAPVPAAWRRWARNTRASVTAVSASFWSTRGTP